MSNVTQRLHVSSGNGEKSDPVYATLSTRMSFPADKVSIPRRSVAVALMRLAAGASGLGDAILRPREARVLGETGGAGTEALVERIVLAGSELRAELRLADGSTVWARLPREEAEQLEIGAGQILEVRFAAAHTTRSGLARAA